MRYAEEALEARRNILAEMAEMERVPRGELVVAANEGTCLHILPEVFAEFKKLYPDVSVNVKRSESPKSWKRLSRTPSISGWSRCRSGTSA